MKATGVFLLSLGWCTGWAVSPETASGSLVMVGGGLRASNTAVYRAFTERAGEGGIGIVPAASSQPDRSARRFAARLRELGWPGERLVILPLASVDDEATPGVDEGDWRRNGGDEALAEQIAGLGGLWFVGGDQARIIDVLVGDSGETPVLAAIRQLYHQGGVIGGTSAGAAMMSPAMILGGSSPEALWQGTEDDYHGMEMQEEGPVRMGSGLGFFPHGLIDQHFDRKARLGRLIVAIEADESGTRRGFGIDEDTALVYDAPSDSARVLGSGTVTLVDLTEAKRTGSEWTGIRLSVLTAGDSLAWPGPRVGVNPLLRPTVGHEYMKLDRPMAVGLLSPYGGRLEDVLGFLLLDNGAADRVESVVKSADDTWVRLDFVQDDRSRGYAASLDGEYLRFTSVDVLLEIRGLPRPDVPKD